MNSVLLMLIGIYKNCQSFLLMIYLWITCFLVNSITSLYFRKRHNIELADSIIFSSKKQKKPQWVINKIIYLKAIMPGSGCRKISEVFNNLHASKDKMTVGKTFVYQVFIKYQHDIYLKRRQLRNRKVKNFPANKVWSIDLTTVTDKDKYQHKVLGMLDNGTRANLLLKRLDKTTSLQLITEILKLAIKYGKPKKLRSDNEAIFTSTLFRTMLSLSGIKHQRTQIACPWMNGRIERFFGTLKQNIKQIVVKGNELDQRLREFRFFYNHVRPHSNLNGKIPADVWSKKLTSHKNFIEVNLWQGILCGYYRPE